jgi:hypothetical protein
MHDPANYQAAHLPITQNAEDPIFALQLRVTLSLYTNSARCTGVRFRISQGVREGGRQGYNECHPGGSAEAEMAADGMDAGWEEAYQQLMLEGSGMAAGTSAGIIYRDREGHR